MAAGKHKKTPKRSTFQKDSAAQTSSLRRIRVPAANQFPLVSETSSIGMHKLAHSPHTRQQEADGVATGPCRFVSMVTAPLLLLLLQSITNQLTPSCEPALSADRLMDLSTKASRRVPSQSGLIPPAATTAHLVFRLVPLLVCYFLEVLVGPGARLRLPVGQLPLQAHHVLGRDVLAGVVNDGPHAGGVA